jgi:hypothetical protein
MLLCSLLIAKAWPEWLHIDADEAYTPFSAEYNYQILTPYSQQQLISAKKQDWQNLQDWEARRMDNPLFIGNKSIPTYWKMRSFNHKLSMERIKVERVLGMIICRFGITNGATH